MAGTYDSNSYNEVPFAYYNVDLLDPGMLYDIDWIRTYVGKIVG